MAVDQSAAFDGVEVELLLQKLQRYNVGLKARTWIRDYLTQRTQYVKIGTARSSMKEMKTGVPQGSVIGPILYAIMTNDMTETVKDRNCNMIEHQDTTNLFGKQCEDGVSFLCMQTTQPSRYQVTLGSEINSLSDATWMKSVYI